MVKPLSILSSDSTDRLAKQSPRLFALREAATGGGALGIACAPKFFPGEATWTKTQGSRCSAFLKFPKK
jgi:hypothetical protein